MFIGKVIGNVVCTQKDERLIGIKLMIVQLTDPCMNENGKVQIALDGIGVCGIGDHVYLSKGKEAGLLLRDKSAPTDLSIVGIIDKINYVKE